MERKCNPHIKYDLIFADSQLNISTLFLGIVLEIRHNSQHDTKIETGYFRQSRWMIENT
jgi:hypothetical protein